MQVVINGFTTIIEIIKQIHNVIETGIHSIVVFLEYLVVIVNQIRTIIQTLPSWLIPYATMSLSIIIVLLILGRQGGTN